MGYSKGTQSRTSFVYLFKYDYLYLSNYFNSILTKININTIARKLEANTPDTEQWLDHKSIDDSSLDNYLNDLAIQTLKLILGEMALTGDRRAAVKEIYDVIGTAFQLGYVTCEAQLEKSFLSGDSDG